MKGQKPERILYDKISELLKNNGENDVLKEAEEMFPNFIDYLKKEYGDFIIHPVSSATMGGLVWLIFSETEEHCLAGLIKPYREETEGQTAEFGYLVELLTAEKFTKLEYREGYHAPSEHTGKIVSSKHPLRYDKENIPFP